MFVTLNTQIENLNSGAKLLFDTGASVSLMTPGNFAKFKHHQLVRRKVDVVPHIADASGNEQYEHHGCVRH